MELRHLRYFVAVADELHFGRAAERLRIAQPPLSQQIRRLESELGTVLFDRTNRRVALTDAGRAFLVDARQILAHVERATESAARASRGETGQLVIGHMASAELNVFPRLLPVIRTRHPGIELEFQLLGASEQTRMLHEGRIHAGFPRLPVNEPGLAVKTLVSEPLVAVLPERHPLARRRALTLRTLAREPLVLFQRRHAPGYYDRLLSFFDEAGVRPGVVAQTTRLYTTLSLVASGRGVSLMPKCIASLTGAGVVFRSLGPRAPRTEMGIAWNPANPSRLLRAFLAVVEDVFATTAAASDRKSQRRLTPPPARKH